MAQRRSDVDKNGTQNEARRGPSVQRCGDAIGRLHLLRGLVWPKHSSEMLGLAATDQHCMAVLAAGDGVNAYPGLLVRGGPLRLCGLRLVTGDAREVDRRILGDSFAEDASGKGVKAWAVRHGASVQHQDVLVERLRRIDSELASL